MVNNSKVNKLFIYIKLYLSSGRPTNSLGIVGRERPPFLNALHIEPFGWTRTLQTYLESLGSFSFLAFTFFVHSCIMLLSNNYKQVIQSNE